MNGPLDWLAIIFGYNSANQNGSPVVDSTMTRVLNFIGAVVTYNSDTQALDVTFPTASGTPVAAITKSSSFSIASPAVNATYSIQTSTLSVVATITGTPVDGVELTFVDATQLWSTHRFGFQCQAGAETRNPEDVAAADTSGQVDIGLVAGESFTIKWFASDGKWYPI